MTNKSVQNAKACQIKQKQQRRAQSWAPQHTYELIVFPATRDLVYESSVKHSVYT